MKSGTTSLYHYVRRHPQVFMPETKEPNFFSRDRNWQLGVPWYEQLFQEAGDALAVGEASIAYTAYQSHRNVPLRVFKVLPDARLIYLVRHPVERMISHAWMDSRKGVEFGPVEEALLSGRRYTEVSLYAMQIERYLDHFPLERLLVLKSEDFRSQNETTLKAIFEFLGVDPARMPAEVRREWNTGHQERKRPVEAKLRRVPAYGLLSKATPEPLRKLKRRLMTDVPRRPIISNAVRKELEDRVRDDVRRPYNYAGPGFDGWGLA